jgi:transcriptional regulator with XRE-family HTH domain
VDDERDLARTIAGLVRRSRRDIGWSQEELARRATVSQACVSRIERDGADTVAFGALARVVHTCGARWSLQSPRLEERLRQRDPAHARCSAHIRRRLEGLGYLVEQEVEIGDVPTRGWIDLLAYEPTARVLHLGEIKTEMLDLGRIQRQIRWYEREAWTAARALGWRPRLIVVGLYLLATTANDEAISMHRQLVGQLFPVRATQLSEILERASELVRPPGWALALVDPLSRRAAWLRPAWVDGRRAPAPYSNYADFMDSWRRRRRSHK